MLYKIILKAIWTNGIPDWEYTSISIKYWKFSNTNKVTQITGAPWYVAYQVLHKDLEVQTVKSEMSKSSFNINLRWVAVYPFHQLTNNWEKLLLSKQLRKLEKLGFCNYSESLRWMECINLNTGLGREVRTI